MLRLLLVFGLVAALAGCASAARPAPSAAGNEALVNQFITAFNAGDARAVANLFTDDGILYILSGGQPFQGRAKLEEMFRGDAVYGIQINVEKMQVEGDTITADAVLTSTKKGAPQPGKVKYTWTFKDGKIATVRLDPRP